MATLVVVTHEYDSFLFRRDPSRRVTSAYLFFDVAKYLYEMGHRTLLARGPEAIEGDAALLHVDATIVSQEYRDLESRYERAFNFRTFDISKRHISRLILARNDRWDGPVIVKSNYNNKAIVEDVHNRLALEKGRPAPHPGIATVDEYRVLDRIDEVEERVWSDPALVVERFVPEQDGSGNFVLRTWVFMGPRERCTRFVTEDRISKAAGVLSYEPIEVPPKLRAERKRLGFDFGKFDFVMHDGEPVLLDANRTPGTAAAIREMMEKGARNLAEGMHELLTGP
jgi:hypothetical protein